MRTLLAGRLLRAAVAATVVLSLSYPNCVDAQLRVQVAPALGAYVPASALPPLGPVPCFTKGSGPCRPNWSDEQLPAFALGGRVTASSWRRQWFVMDGTFWYMPSRVRSGYADGTHSDQSANIVVAASRFVLRFAPKAQVSGLLIGGPGVLHRFGGFYSGVKGATSVVGSLGVGLDVRSGGRFALRAEIVDFLSKARFGSGSLTPEQQISQQQGYLYVSPGIFQHDFVFSLSISPFHQREENN